MKYNIAINLPDVIRDKSIEMSQLVVKNGGIFTLGTQNNFPHITIAHFECSDDKRIEKIISDVKRITDILQEFDIKQNKYRMREGWVDISFQESNEILSLYEIVLNILQEYNCQKTSTNWCINAPHITFSRVVENKQFDINVLPKYDFSFTIDKIGIFELGEHGTNKKLLEEFTLQ